jgi:DNA-binding transcriptional LysR family regulator
VKGLLRGTLAVGTLQCLGTVNLPAILARFHASHPGVEIRLQQGGSTDLIERVRTVDLDLAFVCAPLHGPPAVTLTPVAEEPMVRVCGPPTRSAIATPSTYGSCARRPSSTSTPAG